MNSEVSIQNYSFCFSLCLCQKQHINLLLWDIVIIITIIIIIECLWFSFVLSSNNIIYYIWILIANIPMRFGRKGDFITASTDPDSADSHNSEKTFNQLLIDISTSFTLLLAIFFPSCTGIFSVILWNVLKLSE